MRFAKRWVITVTVSLIQQRLPEGEDDKAGDDENGSKQSEDEVAGFSPTCIVEHFGWLERKKREISITFSFIPL